MIQWLQKNGLGLLSGVLTAVNPVAGGIVSALAMAVGSEEETPDAILNELKTNPDALQKAREFVLKHKERLEELALEREKAYLADRKDARLREVQVQNSHASWLSKNTGSVIAIMTVFLTFLMLGLILFKVADFDQNLGYAIITGLFSMTSGIFGYFYGTSQNEAEAQRASQTKEILKGDTNGL